MATHPANRCITIDADILPQLTAIYLRVAENECAFFETNTAHAWPKALAALLEAGKSPLDVRYVLVTHAHLDHAAGASAFLESCPNATLLAHPRAARHLIAPEKLIASASAVYGAERFAELYGKIEPIPASRVRILEEGDSFSLGDQVFEVLHTQGHANHHLVVHDRGLSSVFTGDTFGLLYPRLQTAGTFVLPSTSPTNFDAAEARKSIERIRALRSESVRPTHFGAHSEVEEIAQQMMAWIDLVEPWVSLAANSGEGQNEMTQRLRVLWREAIRAKANDLGLALSQEDLAFLELDIDLNAQGLAVAALQMRSKS